MCSCPRKVLFRALVDCRIVFAVHWGLVQSAAYEECRQMTATSGEIMMARLDHNIDGVGWHVLGS